MMFAYYLFDVDSFHIAKLAGVCVMIDDLMHLDSG